MRAVYIDQPGGVEALQVGDLPEPEAGPGQVLAKVEASGVNFIDIYHRSGLYKLPLPAILGMEGSGVVEAVGSGVTKFAAGDRVAWAMTRGSYAEFAAIPETHLARVPDGVSLEDAAAVMLQGATAHYLTHSTFPLQSGQTALVHAAAGGTGRLIVQMAKIRGARVIGTASTPEKVQIARDAGADHVILYNEQDFQEEARRLTGNRGVDVVYDSVGVATWEKSLASLRPRGMLVLFGQSSGPVPPLNPQLLAQCGSLFLTRPTLAHYMAGDGEFQGRVSDLFGWLQDGRLNLRIGGRFRLAEAGLAQDALAGRGTTGKLLLLIK